MACREPASTTKTERGSQQLSNGANMLQTEEELMVLREDFYREKREAMKRFLMFWMLSSSDGDHLYKITVVLKWSRASADMLSLSSFGQTNCMRLKTVSMEKTFLKI